MRGERKGDYKELEAVTVVKGRDVLYMSELSYPPAANRFLHYLVL